MNTHSYEMEYRCPAARSLGAAKLLNHEFRFARHADVVESALSDTDGVLWEITDKCLHSLDRLEGYPTYYDRKLALVAHNGRMVEAVVYFMVGTPEISHPSKGYLEMLYEGYLEHGVSTKQIEESLSILML